MIYILIFIAVTFLAYSNGANDNFKGVATLFGSGTTDYKKAINWAAVTTALGSIVSIFFASTLPIAAIISALVYFVLKSI